MTSRHHEIGEFLRTRRAQLSPAEVGLPTTRNGRRVSGLRREELAMLAGVSPDYYARLEQGRAVNVSEQVLDAVAGALRLDDLERRHLSALVRRQAGPAPERAVKVRRELRAMVAALDPVPAMLHGPRFEVLAINRMGRALIHDFDTVSAPERNLIRWTFTDPRAREIYVDWTSVAAQLVSALRLAAEPDDPALFALVNELRSAAPEFTRVWDDHRVSRHSHGPKRFRNDVVGELTLSFETMHLADDSGLSLTLYTADPGSPSAERLAELWNRLCGEGVTKR
jgi:transcriptional regulator with XRE-family HTH domain